MSATQRTPDWGYARRAKLADEVRSAIYEFTHKGQAGPKERFFVEEARKLLPDLHKEIDRHNTRVRRVKERRREKFQKQHNASRMVDSAKNIAMFGTDKECQALADKWLLKHIRKEAA